MSENLDLVRSIYADWERGDYRSNEWADPEIECVFADGPTPGTWTGLAGMAEAWRGFLSAWEEFSQEADEYRELDDERVLVLTRFSGRGKTSGLELGQVRPRGASLFHLRAGKVTRHVAYVDCERALADLGLPSAAGSPGAMLPEDLESLRQVVDTFNRRDRAAWLARCDPDLENIPPREWPESESIRGREAVWDFFVEGNEPWEESRFEIFDPIDAGNDKVVMELRAELRGKASGASVAWSYWLVLTFRDGRALRFEWFADRAEALEAAGLRE